MPYKVEVLPSPKSIIGEGPHWDEHYQSLYYNDIQGAAILRYDYEENKIYSAAVDDESSIGFIIPVANFTKTSDYDEFALGLGRRVGIVHWDGKSSRAAMGPIAFEVEEDEPDKENNRFNDAKADPVGRFYGGTMTTGSDFFENAAGSLYKYNKGDGAYDLINNIYISNGLAWNEKKNKFYYIDSGKFDVKEYDWDRATGDISNERVVIDFSDNGKNPGFVPDGMTIDTEGNLYVATFGGGKVLKVDPEKGKVVLEIQIPATQVTSVTFGGPNLDELFVTTASIPDFNNKTSELSGRLFKVSNLGAKGFPGVQVRV